NLKDEMAGYEDFLRTIDDKEGILDSQMHLSMPGYSMDEGFVKEESLEPSSSKKSSNIRAHPPKKYHGVRKADHSSPFTCGQCGEKFNYGFQLTLHYNIHIVRPKAQVASKKVMPVINRVQQTKDDPSWRGHSMELGCFFNQTKSKRGVQIHYKAESEGTSYIDCDTCGQRFGSVSDHREHALKEHPLNLVEQLCKNRYCVSIRELNEPKEKLEVAPVTSTQFNHILHPMFEPINCPICFTSKPTYFHLYSHFMTCHAMEYMLRFVCRGCGHIYTSPRGLKNHIINALDFAGSPCRGTADILPPNPRKKRATEVKERHPNDIIPTLSMDPDYIQSDRIPI
ncbi:hypothetical protein PFISCL1PPCAC_27291, partial [Pristionchus fissidentatus]